MLRDTASAGDFAAHHRPEQLPGRAVELLKLQLLDRIEVLWPGVDLEARIRRCPGEIGGAATEAGKPLGVLHPSSKGGWVPESHEPFCG